MLPTVLVHECNEYLYSADPKRDAVYLVFVNHKISHLVMRSLRRANHPIAVSYSNTTKVSECALFNLPNGELKPFYHVQNFIVDHCCFERHPLRALTKVTVINILKKDISKFLEMRKDRVSVEDAMLAFFREVFGNPSAEESGKLLFGEEFSVDCMLQILMFCDLQTLLDFSLVNKKAYEIGDVTIWKYIFFNEMKLNTSYPPDCVITDKYKYHCCLALKNWKDARYSSDIADESELDSFDLIAPVTEWSLYN